MKNFELETLGDVGEMRLIDEVILPLAREYDAETSAGDDCAYISVGGLTFAATTDVGPRPLIMELQSHREDWEAAGWMAVVATVSDVATAGAKPLFLSNCIDAPADLPVSVLQTFLKGYFRAMSEFCFKNGGGDLRQGPKLAARVFGMGVVQHKSILGRDKATEGDHLVVIGPTGDYMSKFLYARWKEAQVNDSSSSKSIPDDLRFPRPQLLAMQQLAKSGLISTASDTSDGLLGAIDNISRSSNCCFSLVLNDQAISNDIRAACSVTDVASPWNLFFAWGDWSVAAIVPQSKFREFQENCELNGIQWTSIGAVSGKGRKIKASVNGAPDQNVEVIRNENFLSQGFNAGIDGHLEYILKTRIFLE